MSFFKKLFGLGGASAPEADNDSVPENYKGYMIQPTPVEEGGAFRVCGIISREVDGERKEHRFIRADQVPSREIADTMILSKARLMIDQLGDSVFRQR